MMLRPMRFDLYLGRAVLGTVLLTLSGAVLAQSPAAAPASDTASGPVVNSTLNAPLFYQLLLGEMQVNAGEPGAGYSLILDAARKQRDGQLYRRAVELALQARSGEAALAWLRTHDDPIDLLVTDQNMPGLSGVDVARAIRRLRPGQRIAIVSGHVSDELLAEAAAAGVNEVLGKQDSMEALGAAIRQLLEA